MPVTEKEFINAILSKTLNMDETAVASLYNEDGTIKDESTSTILTLDVERIKAAKPSGAGDFDKGYQKAQSEILTKKDKELMDKFGIKSDKKGVELVNEIISEQVKKSGVDLNDEAVKKHPLFISTVDRLTKDKEDAITAESGKLTQFQTELKRKETFNFVANKALSYFNSLDPILYNDSTKAENQRSILIEKLEGFYEYDIQGEKIIVLKDGKILEDEHGNRIPFEKVVKQVSDKYFEYHVTTPKASPGNGKAQPNGTSVKSTLEAPKSQQHFIETIANSKIPIAERVAYESEYAAKFSTNPQN